MKYKYFVLFVILCFLLNLYAFSSIIEKLIIDGSIYTEDMLSKHMIIIGADEIKNSKVKSMSDLFSFLPGVDVNRRGQGSTSYDLVMRGSNFEQILIMVNGIPVNNLQTGHFNTDLPFTPEDIERVEISRGGNSVFYGISGFAGIINIILKKRSDIKLNIYATGYFNSTSKTTQNYLKFHSDYNKKNVLLSGGIDLNLIKTDSTTMGLHTQKRW